MSDVLLALMTAVMSSVMTWLLAYLLYRKALERRIERLREELAAEVEERVRRGAIKAGEELLPEFRKEVTAGFKDALRGVVTGSDVARTMAKTGADIVGGGLDSLFGQRKRSRFMPW